VAGYREFQTGEVLTAANVNDFLMEQAVMTFADATARAAALADVLREGILTYNEDTAQLEVYDGSAFVVAAPVVAGIGSNVVQTVKTDTQTFSQGVGVVSADVTGLTVSITPSSATSLVLVLFSINVGLTGVEDVDATLYRNGSPTGLIGDAAGARIRSSGGASRSLENTSALITGHYLDNPASASAVTYSLRMHHSFAGGTAVIQINRTGSATDNNSFIRTASAITAIEVKA
jgi:hypothetical protein